MVSFFADGGDATLCEVGIIRCGYSGNNVTKYALLTKAGVQSMITQYPISVYANELGNIAVSVDSMQGHKRIVIIG